MDDNHDRRCCSDDPEEAAKETATATGFAGSVLGAVGGPVGAGIGGLIGGTAGYVAGYTAASAKEAVGSDEPVSIDTREEHDAGHSSETDPDGGNDDRTE